MSSTQEADLHDVTIASDLAGTSAGLRGVLGVPEGEGPWPGIVVVHEAFGITEVMRRQVQRLVRTGYLVLMPDRFTEMGGGFALMTATRGFDAASANYGMLPRDLDVALAGACPIIGSYGADDSRLKGAAAKLDESLARLKVPHEVTEYPGAGHAFLNDAPSGPRILRPLMRVSGMGPRPEQAAEAWARIDAFFAKHLAKRR